MGRILVGLILWLPILISVAIVFASEDRLNKSASAGLFWSTAKEEADLYRKAKTDESAMTLNENNELDGGFSTLDGMLHWAIGHSDPAKLKETAQDVHRLSTEELKKRQNELKDLVEKLKMPSDAQLMQIAVADLNNSSLSLDDHLRALEELLLLVEPIDNANDLSKLGGLAVIVRQLDNVEPEVRKLSAWVIGKASQNNPLVQKQVLEHGTLTKLMNMVRSNHVEEAIKALYAVSALIRNNADGQQIFYAGAGDLLLQEILSNSSFDIRLRRKSVFLVGDLAEHHLENPERPELPFFNNRLFLKSVVDLTAPGDLDLQEKALTAIKSLLNLKTTQGVVFKDFCNLDNALEGLRLQLQPLMEEVDQKDYATDLESLRQEVESIFHKKLDQTWQGMQVPT